MSRGKFYHICSCLIISFYPHQTVDFIKQAFMHIHNIFVAAAPLNLSSCVFCSAFWLSRYLSFNFVLLREINYLKNHKNVILYKVTELNKRYTTTKIWKADKNKLLTCFYVCLFDIKTFHAANISFCWHLTENSSSFSVFILFLFF